MVPSHSNPRKKLRIPVEERAGLIKRLKDGESKKDLAAEFGVTRQYIELLQKKHDQGGDAALIPKQGGRTRLPEGSLTPEQFEAIVLLVEGHTPLSAGLNLKKQPEQWTLVYLRALIAREYRIRLDSEQFDLLENRLGILGPLPLRAGIEDDLDDEFFAYINSPIGREVARREQEWRERDERDRVAIPGESVLTPKPDKDKASEGKPKSGVGNTSKSPRRGPNFSKPKRRKPKKRR